LIPLVIDKQVLAYGRAINKPEQGENRKRYRLPETGQAFST